MKFVTYTNIDGETPRFGFKRDDEIVDVIRSGIWVNENNESKKIAAIGVRISKGVTMHGFSVNISNDLSEFDHIIPCGMPGLESTSLKNELTQNIELVDFSSNVVNNFIKELAKKK